MKTVLNIENLSVSFPTADGTVDVVKNVALQVKEGEITGLVGESGSGKTMTAMSVMGLQPENARVTAGRIEVAGQDVSSLDRQQLASIRGKHIALVPQEPMNSLNPSMRIGKQLEIVLRTHRSISPAEARTVAREYLVQMMISDPERVMQSFPFEISGGMRQRVLLVMAFSCRPGILIADEPTTALDVTIQRQVLDLLQSGAKANEAAVLFITHDLGVVWNLCHQVYVMRRGEIVESGPAKRVIENPSHAYTKRLLAALPESTPRRMPLPLDIGADDISVNAL